MKKSLARKFTRLFILFALITIITSGITTYIGQTENYHKECMNNLAQITSYMATRIENEGEEFAVLKQWFRDHTDQVQIPLNYREDMPRARKEFISYLNSNYPGRIFGDDLSFDQLTEEGQRLYVIYRFEYWFTFIFDTIDKYDLEYAYFIFPEEDKELTMNYMFDPGSAMELPDQEAGDGKYFLLGDQVYEDPGLHKYMWKTWEEGKAQDGFDSLNNQYGYLYTYCYPVVIDGQKIGLICADINVYMVTKQIITVVVRQMLLTILVLIITTIFLYKFLKSSVIDRIIRLEDDISEYSREKDPAISEKILASRGQADELGGLYEKFSGMITELDDYMDNLQKVTAEKERIGAELNVATQIQADMLPRIFPPFPDRKEFDIYATMTPAKEVGGDFYDFFLVDDKHLALVIADVSGKGVPAALFMVIAKTLIKTQVMMGESPAEALEHVNEQLCEGNEAELFVTVWLAVIDLETGHVLEANAGHEHPAIRRADGVYELRKTKHSPAVAVMEGMRFRQTEFDLMPGDTIFVYTDGVTEATDKDDQLFGEQRLLTALEHHKEEGPKGLLPAVRQEIDAFVADAPQFDDITMLGMIYYGNDKNE